MAAEKTISEPRRELPVRYEGYDVIVAGGGVAGISAASPRPGRAAACCSLSACSSSAGWPRWG